MIFSRFQAVRSLASRPPLRRTPSSSSSSSLALSDPYPLWLAGQAVHTDEQLAVTDKYTGEVATHVSVASVADIDRSIAAAVEAKPRLAALGGWERRDLCHGVVEAVQARQDEFAHALCIEAGKPIKDAKVEVLRMMDTFTLAAEEATRCLNGETMELDVADRYKGARGMTRRFPAGVLSFIAPFNFPCNLLAHKVAPAIACGCPFIVKPASRTPVTALLLGEILADLLQPVAPGAFSILPCHRDAADLFTVDDRLAVLSFTGSPEVGWALKAKAGKKKVILELGGNAACIVDETLDDAQLDRAVDRIVFGAFYQSGQSCISVQRVLVHRSVYDQVKERLVERTGACQMGDPRSTDTFVGPLITPGDADRVRAWIDEAVAGGGTVLVGGERGDGAMLSPAIVENAPRDCRLTRQEVFGPALTLAAFDDFTDAIAVVNDSDFGLQAGVFTNNLHRAHYAFEHLEMGGVVVNDVPSLRVDAMPYGGVRDSGLGREGVRYAIQDYTEERLLLLKDVGQL